MKTNISLEKLRANDPDEWDAWMEYFHMFIHGWHNYLTHTYNIDDALVYDTANDAFKKTTVKGLLKAQSIEQLINYIKKRIRWNILTKCNVNDAYTDKHDLYEEDIHSFEHTFISHEYDPPDVVAHHRELVFIVKQCISSLGEKCKMLLYDVDKYGVTGVAGLTGEHKTTLFSRHKVCFDKFRKAVSLVLTPSDYHFL